MPKTQNKNNIAWVGLSLIFLFLGEGIFSLGIYLVPLLKLSNKDWSFYLALGLGIILSLMTGSALGLASLLLVIYLLLARALIGFFRDNLIVLGVLMMVANYAIDKVVGGWWNILEAGIIFVLILVMGLVTGNDHDLKLRG